MNIAFIGQKGIPASFGGVERHVEELAIRLAQNHGNKIFVYSRAWYVENPTKDSKLINLNPKPIFVPSIRTKHLDAISHSFIASIHALFQPYDVIHYQGIGPALLSFIPRILKPKTKITVTYHCADYEHQKWGIFAKMMLKLGEKASMVFPHKTISVSKSIQFQLEKRYHKEIVYIPNGASKVNKQEETDEIAHWNLQPNGYFLTVNRLVRHKGIHHLIEAYQQLYSIPQVTDKKLVIVGDSAFTSDYVQELKSLAYGNPNIIFTGYQTGSKLESLYKNAYLYIQPSESEGLPIAVLEAILYKIPILTSDIDANLEISARHGLYFKNKDLGDLRSKMVFALNNPKHIEEMAEQAQRWSQKEYDWDEIAGKTNLIYKNLLLPESNIAKNKYRFVRFLYDR